MPPRAKRKGVAAGAAGWLPVLAAVLLLGLLSAGAAWHVYAHGWLLYYGDAEAHLNIARRIVDSRTPGYDQLGTVWLPLPHVLLLPFVGDDRLWRTGLAAVFPMGACFVIAGAFLFAAVRRTFASTAAAWVALALFALNPNILYLQSLAMSELPFFAAFCALLYFSVRFRQTQGWGALAGAAIAACVGTLSRYEGWFLLPFAALYILLAARERRWRFAAVFCAIAALGPLYWFGHNWWLTGDPLSFYWGPWSARAIQGKVDYPGRGDWLAAFTQFRAAATLCAGPALPWMAMAGLAAALWRRAWWPVLLLLLPGVFYVWSLHSSGTPIYVPHLRPHTYYNTRYGLAVLPLFALAAAALVTVAPARVRAAMAGLVLLAGAIHWIVYPRPESWITWKESQVNSAARRAWTHAAAQFLAAGYRPGAGVLTSFGDLTGIYREAGIPLHETFTGDNGIPFDALLLRPDLHLRQEWAVAVGGDPVQTAVWKGPRFGKNYSLVRQIIVKGAPVVEIYRR